MLLLALKMLIGNKASCLGVIFGVFLATLLISQQSAIFLGLVSRSYRMVTDIPTPNLWIIDPSTESDDKVRGIPAGYLDVVRSIPGVAWAAPIHAASVPLATETGIFDIGKLYGINDATLIGAPLEIVEGNLYELRREGGVIVDIYSANSSLAKTDEKGKKIPLKVGDSFEINSKRAVVIALCKITQGFYPQPILYTSNRSFKEFIPGSAKTIEFIVAKSMAGANISQILQKINAHPNLNGMTSKEMSWRMAKSFLKTGILLNFGLSVALGIIIGFSIAGQVFYVMTLQNLMYYALIKAIGSDPHLLTKMILVQVFVVGLIGYILGTGTTMVWGFAVVDTTLAFLFPWQLLLFTGLIVFIICLFTADLSLRRIFKTDPKVLMGN